MAEKNKLIKRMYTMKYRRFQYDYDFKPAEWAYYMHPSTCCDLQIELADLYMYVDRLNGMEYGECRLGGIPVLVSTNIPEGQIVMIRTNGGRSIRLPVADSLTWNFGRMNDNVRAAQLGARSRG